MYWILSPIFSGNFFRQIDVALKKVWKMVQNFLLNFGCHKYNADKSQVKPSQSEKCTIGCALKLLIFPRKSQVNRSSTFCCPARASLERDWDWTNKSKISDRWGSDLSKYFFLRKITYEAWVELRRERWRVVEQWCCKDTMPAGMAWQVAEGNISVEGRGLHGVQNRES